MELAIADVFNKPYHAWDGAFLDGLRSRGFHSVGLYEQPLTELGETGRRDLKRRLDDAGLRVHSWFVVCHTHIRPKDSRRPGDLDRFRRNAEFAALLGADSIGTSPGSFDERHHWTAHPDNARFDTLRLVADSLAEIVPICREVSVKLGLEFGVPTAVPTVEAALWLIDAVGSANLGVYADPANQVQGYERLFNSGQVMDQFFDVLGRHVLCAHARDAWLEPGLEMHIRTGGPGDGIVDYRSYLSRVRDLDPSMSLLLEHAPQDRIDQYLAYVHRICAEIGLAIEP
jgi:sugar phosphate isomerase/epimerase